MILIIIITLQKVPSHVVTKTALGTTEGAPESALTTMGSGLGASESASGASGSAPAASGSGMGASGSALPGGSGMAALTLANGKDITASFLEPPVTIELDDDMGPKLQ
eukprot:8481070-Karenia_brevis.AAC.1